MKIRHTRATYTFVIEDFEPFWRHHADGERDILVEQVSVWVHVEDGALTLVGTSVELRGRLAKKDGMASARAATRSGSNLASLSEEMRSAIKAALFETAGEVADPKGQLDGLFLRRKERER